MEGDNSVSFDSDEDRKTNEFDDTQNNKPELNKNRLISKKAE